MSRVGRKPIEVPKGVQVKITGDQVEVSGPKGTLSLVIDTHFINAELKENQVLVTRKKEIATVRAKHGLYRALIYNMIKGVTDGYEKTLQLVGVGYRASMQGKKLVLALGFSHPIEVDPPAGISFKLDGPNKITVIGADKQLVGQVAQDIRYSRPVEPYKGKGIKERGQYVLRKEGKKK